MPSVVSSCRDRAEMCHWVWLADGSVIEVRDRDILLFGIDEAIKIAWQKRNNR